MKREIPKVSWTTKFNSNRNYIQEVSIDDKRSSQLNKKLGYYGLFVPEVMRNGNCLTLLTSTFTFSVAAFKNANQLADNVKYIFWTFNEGFLMQLKESFLLFTIPALEYIQQLLTSHFTPYEKQPGITLDEELEWCILKNSHLKADGDFATMYQKDIANRQQVLAMIAELITSKQHTKLTAKKESRTANKISKPSSKKQSAILLVPERISFVEMLQPMEGSTANTKDFIQQSLAEVKTKYNIFEPVRKTKSNKNPKGFNGSIAAVILFFYERNYFAAAFSKEDILDAFLHDHGVTIPKYNGNFSFFNTNYDCQSLVKKLNRLKIKQLPKA